MFPKISAYLAIFGASYVSCAVQLIPRGKIHELFTGFTTNASEANSTTPPSAAAVTIEPGYPTTSLDCCYIQAAGGGVDELIWWSSSIEITVATVSTVVYQYNNTTITSYTTNSVYRASNPLPTTLDTTNTYGVPIGLISNYDDSYWPTTSLIYDTAFTDPYGVVYASPTPVFMHLWATAVTAQGPIYKNSTWQCPTADAEINEQDGTFLDIPPHGFYMAGDAEEMYNSLEIWQPLPSQLFSWWASYDSDQIITTCTPGYGYGQPTAHIPVAQITAAAIEISTINSYYGPTPTSTPPPPAGPTSTSPSISSFATGPPDSSSYTPPLNNGPTASNPPPSITGTSNSGPGDSGADNKEAGSPPPPISTTVAIITNGGSTFTENSGGNFVIGSSTLSRGGIVVVSNSGSETTFVLPDSGTAVVINGKTQAVQRTAVQVPAITTPVIVIGSSTYTANPASQFVIDGQTLTQGGVITAAGEAVSLAPGGSSVVLMSGSVTETESVGEVTGTSTATSQTKSTHTSGAGLRTFADVWVIGGCLSAGLLGVLGL